MRYCFEIAARMLRTPTDIINFDMPDLDLVAKHGRSVLDLKERLARIDDLCVTCGGSLVSRQIIATIINDWERNG